MANENQLAKIISLTREIETILKEKFLVKGKGLHTYLDSVESKLDSGLVRNLRYLATIRNKSMHENNFEVDNFSRYEKVAKESILALQNITIPREKRTLINSRERARQKPINPKKNSLFKQIKNIIYIVTFLLLLVNFKLIILFVSDIFESKNKNVKEEQNFLIEDILDEDGEIKDLGYRHVVKEVLPHKEKEIKNVIYISPKYSFKCTGKKYCSQMSSCAEATFYIKNCPNTKMDGDGDGIPCRRQWCH